MSVIKIRPRQQVTIPKGILSQLHLNAGDFIEAEVEEGKIIITPKRLTVKEDTIPLTKEEQKNLFKTKKKIDQIN